MRRREFITLIGGAAAAWPFAAGAQQPMRRVAEIMTAGQSDPLGPPKRLPARWTEGRNVKIDIRWTGSADRMREIVAEFVALKPDVILANGTPDCPLERAIT